MDNALSLIMMCYEFMRDTTIISFTLGGTEISLTALNVAIGCTVIAIGIDVLHSIFDY